MILFSSSCEAFYVHRDVLLRASDNNFFRLLPPQADKAHAGSRPQILSISENSNVVDLILHAVYNIHHTVHLFEIDILVAVFESMVKYGFTLKKYAAPSTLLYNLVLCHAPVSPFETYALAASHDLYDLAAPISSHLLSCSLCNLTDELARRIGPIYLWRLIHLHLERIDALKQFLLQAPHPHPESDTCDFLQQKRLSRAWSLAAAYLTWDSHPGA